MRRCLPLLRVRALSASAPWGLRWTEYTKSMFAAGLLYAPVQRRIKPLPVSSLPLFILPMTLDDGSRFMHDLLEQS